MNKEKESSQQPDQNTDNPAQDNQRSDQGVVHHTTNHDNFNLENINLPKSLQMIEAEIRQETVYPNLDMIDWRMEHDDESLYVNMAVKNNSVPRFSEPSDFGRNLDMHQIMTESLEVGLSQENLHERSEKEHDQGVNVIKTWLTNFEKYLASFNKISHIKNFEDYKETLGYIEELNEKSKDLIRRIKVEVGNDDEKQIRSSIDRDTCYIKGKTMEIIENLKYEIVEYMKTAGAIPKRNRVEELNVEISNMSIKDKDTISNSLLINKETPRNMDTNIYPAIDPRHLQYGVELEAVRNIVENGAGSQLPIKKGERLTFTSTDPSTNLLKVVQHIGTDFCLGLVSPRDVKFYNPLMEKKTLTQENTRDNCLPNTINEKTDNQDHKPGERLEPNHVRFNTPFGPKMTNFPDKTRSNHLYKDSLFSSSELKDGKRTMTNTKSLYQDHMKTSQDAGRGDAWKESFLQKPFDRRYVASNPITGNNNINSNIKLPPNVTGIRDKIDSVQLNCEMIRDYIQEINDVRNSSYRSKVDFLKGIGRLETDLRNHKKESRSLKRLYEDAQSILDFESPELITRVSETITEAEELSINMTSDLKELKFYFSENKVTMTQLSVKNADQLKYIKFTGTIDQEVGKGPHLYEFLARLHSNFQILQVEGVIRATIIKENLTSAARILIPDSLDNEAQIIRILQDNFGGVTHILNQLKKLHYKLGMVPDPRNSQGNLQLQKRSEIASGHYMLIRRADSMIEHKINASHEVYSLHHLESIARFLPIDDQLKRGRISSSGSDAYERLKAQFENIFLTTSAIKNNSDTTLDNLSYGSTPTSERSRHGLSQDPLYPSDTYRPRRPRGIVENYSMIVDRVVEERPDCQFCHFFQAEGTNSNYFKNHITMHGMTKNWNCPLYVKLPIKEKLSFLERNNICQYCLYPDSDMRMHKLPFDACKRRLSQINKFGKHEAWKCIVNTCESRNELCVKHLEENRPSLERRKYNLGKNNIDFVFINDSEIRKESNHSDRYKNITEDRKIERPLLINEKKEMMFTYEDVSKSSIMNQSILLSMKMKGENRSLNVLFDTGCTSAVVRDSVPGVELKAESTGQKSILQGLGGATESGEAYRIWLPLANGGTSVIEASAVKEITKPLRIRNTLPAFQILKHQAKNNKIIQDAKIQSSSGGQIDILLGMRYITLFPTLVYQSVQGLGLYMLQLLPEDKEKTYCLGGSYRENECFLENQEKGLHCFHEDMNQVLPIFENDNDAIEICPTNETRTRTLENFYEVFPSKLETQTKCPTCEGYSNFDQVLPIVENYNERVEIRSKNKTKTSVLKELKEIFPSRLESNYRCPTCKGCQNCKKGEINELESIKEEREEELLLDSINMNEKTLKFEAILPTLERPSLVLNNNSTSTEKILRRQLKKLQNNPDDIEQIKEGFNKLLTKGYIENLKDMSEETQKKILDKDTKYIIPWTVAYKSNSQSTPVRIVFNASHRTASGKSLNDILPTGKVKLALDRIAFKFVVAPIGIVADISKFYNSFDLNEDYYHLQLMLWNKDFDPDGELEMYVIKTLIYGVRCVSRQTEIAMEKLAKMYIQVEPEFSKLLTEKRYVDDISTSEIDITSANRLIKTSDAILRKHGLVIKGWAISGQKPDDKISNNGILYTAGYAWDPVTDMISIRIPKLHFGTKNKGKLSTNNVYCGSSEEEMKMFVPKELTLRQVTSKTASIFDIRGLISPFMSNLKLLLRETTLLAKGDWDFIVPEIIRNQWIESFLDLEKVKDISFPRCMLKSQPSSLTGILWTFADAGEGRLQHVVYISFPLVNGGWSSQFLAGKNYLCPFNITIPNAELQSAYHASLTTKKIKSHLEDCIVRSILCVDSEVVLHWLQNEKKPLGIFQRNRIGKIKDCFEIQDMFHVSGKLNPSDIGTKGKVIIDDVGPMSVYYNGPGFLQDGLEKAISQGKITPANKLRLNQNCVSAVNDGFINKLPEVGLVVEDSNNVNKVKKRYVLSQYLVDPLKHSYPNSIMVVSIVLLFIKRLVQASIKRKSSAKKSLSLNNLFCNINKTLLPIDLISTNVKKQFNSENDNKISILSLLKYNFEELQSLVDSAQWYYMKKATRELEAFYSRELLTKHGQMVNRILVSNSRWNDACQLQNTIGNDITLSELQIRSQTPMIDRYSPIGISIAKHVHENLTIHKGVDFSYFASLSHVYILHGAQLMREIINDCIFCKKKLKRCFIQSMGPLNSAQLSIGSIMYVVQTDMSGPYTVKLKKNNMSTRGRPAITKVWLQHSVCVMSHITHTEVIEDYGSESFLCGLSRLSSIFGVPKKILIDGDSAEIAALTKSTTSLRSCFNKIQREMGIEMEVCAAGGSAHSRHGLVEKRVFLTKEIFAKLKIDTVDLSVLGFQQLCYEVSNLLNSFPLGFVRKHGQSNSARLITPNHFKIGRSNVRTLGGSFEYPSCRQSVLNGVGELFQGLANYINTVAIPGLLLRPKWYRDDNKSLLEGDLVLFQKKESPFGKDWRMGIVDSIKRGSGDRISLVEISYSNANEIILPLDATHDQNCQNIKKRITRRDLRTICKLFSLSDPGINKDINELSNWLKNERKNVEYQNLDLPKHPK